MNWRTNKGAATLIIAALAPAMVAIGSSDWAPQRASDGFRLGTFPMLFLAVSIALIGVTSFDRWREQPLACLDDASLSGLLKVAAFILAALAMAFFNDTLGFVPCVAGLLATAAIATGQRSLVRLVLFAFGGATLLFGLFHFLGLSIVAAPQF